MTKRKRILSVLLAGILAFSSFPCGVDAANNAKDGTKPVDGMTEGQPFPENLFLDLHDADNGYTRFRIPALTVAADGTLVASCDLRWDLCNDGGGIDTIVTRSTDGGNTWNYSVVNYLGDNGNDFNRGSTAFIDTALANDGNTIYLACDLDPAGISLNTYHSNYVAKAGNTGFTPDGKLLLAKSTESANGNSSSESRAGATYQYHLEKSEEEGVCYRVMENGTGIIQQGYKIDADFNIKSDDGTVDTNLFCGDSPFFPFPTSYVYIKKSTDGGQTWSDPILADVKLKEEQTLLIAPGRGIVVDHEGSQDGKRIIFATYQHTSNTERSSVIYSDDGGMTWQRGMTNKTNHSLNGDSSEVAITEADGRVYMFVRKQNKYAVSEDTGETWSDLKDTGISYLNSCELSAVTYSKKINGKTAILLSVPLGGQIQKPGDTGMTDRCKGRIFVGLVDAETGNITWQNDPYVVTEGHYAYSSMAETADGEIALLYEPAERKITFEKIPMEAIAKNAVISNIWLTDAANAVVANETVMGSDSERAYAVHTAEADATVTVESSDANVLTAVYENGQLKLRTVADVTGLKQVKVTVSAGNECYVLHVDVTDTENYKAIGLNLWETVTVTDKSGDYVASAADAVNEFNQKGYASVSTKSSYAKMYAQGATADGVFNGGLFDLSRCLYTFNKTAENTYQMQATALNAGTVYLNIRNAQLCGNKMVPYGSATNISIKKAGNYFYLQDQGSGSAGNTLVFTGGLFDRQGNVNETTYFELYTPAADGNYGDSAIAGYRKITELSEIQSGKKYLIVTKADDSGNQYLLVPFNGTDRRFEFTAKLVKQTVLPTSTKIIVGDGLSDSGKVQFTGTSTRAVEDCLYTYNRDGSTGVQGRFTAKTQDGTMIYLNFGSLHQKLANNNGSGAVTISGDGNGIFRLNNGNRYLGISADGWLYSCGNSDGDGALEIYTPSENYGDSKIPGYQKLTQMSELKHNGSYLFVKVHNDGETEKRYIVNPAIGTTSSVYTQVGLLTEETVNRTDVKSVGTQITFTGTKVGSSSVQIGDTLYYVTVGCEHGTTATGEAKEPTCGKPGHTAETTCTLCGKVLVEKEEIPATGNHSFSEWKTEKAPTALEEGLEARTCSVCGKREENSLAKLPNTETKLPDAGTLDRPEGTGSESGNPSEVHPAPSSKPSSTVAAGNVSTGDSAQLAIWCFALPAAMLGCVVLGKKRREN